MKAEVKKIAFFKTLVRSCKRTILLVNVVKYW